MNNNLELVKQFQLTGGHSVLPLGQTPSIEDRVLRLKLIFEELSELAEAFGVEKTFADICMNHFTKNIEKADTYVYNEIEALDALCDLEVVVLGGYCISGFSDIASAAFEETMASNMSKFCTTLEDAQLAIAGKEDLEFVKVNNVYVIKKIDTGKILKGPNFYKPNYSKLLEI